LKVLFENIVADEKMKALFFWEKRLAIYNIRLAFLEKGLALQNKRLPISAERLAL
jgi:hypothetical protein